MAQQLYFSRDTKVYIAPLAANGTEQGVWEIPVLDGFSFSQATNSSEITLSEMESAGGVSRRGRRMFNDSLAPAEWSFSTYVRPFISAGTGAGAADDSAHQHAVEEALWALMAGANAYDTVNYDFENTTVINATEMVQGETYEIVSAGTTDFTATGVGGADSTVGTILTRGASAATGTGTVKRKVNATDAASSRFSFHASNQSTVGTANIYFVIGNANKKYYKISKAVVNEAGIDFDIDGIAMINWSGFGSEIVESSQPTATVYEAITATGNFIRNRLTQVAVAPNLSATGQSGLETSYALTLTGGNITISNNITFITPEELGSVNIPIGHVTGTRSVSGSMTCYFSLDTATTDNSSDLWADLKGITSVITNDFGLTFSIGGATGTPRLVVAMPSCHIDIPTHSIEDVISLETSFNALPSTIDATNEATLTYVGV